MKSNCFLSQCKTAAVFNRSQSGVYSRKLLRYLFNIEVKYYIDTFYNASEFDGLQVRLTGELTKDSLGVDVVIIASDNHYQDIALFLESQGIPYIWFTHSKLAFYRSEQGRFAYRPLPKVANTAIKSLIWQANFPNTGSPNKDHIEKIFQQEPSFHFEFEEGYEKITIVREPLLRFVSAFVYCLHKQNNYPNRIFGDDINFFVDNFNYFRHKLYFEVHFAPQVESIGTNLDFYDHVYRLEEMESLQSFLQERCGVSLQRVNASNESSTDFFMRQLTPRSIDKIRHYYEEDYRILYQSKPGS